MITSFITTHLLFILFLTGFFAGLVDAIAGGGGLISLPMLLAVGVPPHYALGTNKVQTTIGTSVATYSYYAKKLFNLKTVYKGLMFGLFGASLGAGVSQIINGDILSQIIPFLLTFILAYTIFSPSLGKIQAPPKMREPLCFALFGFLLGFYDGFFGPGTGSLWVFVLTYFLGYEFINATAYAKVFNLKSNIFATVCFMFAGTVNYHIAFCMAGGQIIGGRLGAKIAISRGAKVIKPVFLTVVSATIFSLVYQNIAAVQLRSFNSLKMVSVMLMVASLSFITFHHRKKQKNKSLLNV